MTAWTDTDAAAEFVATADSRETSQEVMHAIVFFARDEREATQIWEGDLAGTPASFSGIWEHATSNGTRDADLCWGDSGDQWASRL